MIQSNEEQGQVVAKDSWAYQVHFVIKKEVDGGLVKKKLKELDSSVEVLVLNETKLAPEVEVEG